MRRLSAAARFGTSRIASSAAITNRNDTAFSTYAQPTPAYPITRPPSAGPSTEAAWNMMVLRLIAFGRCSRGTRFGISDCRAGPSNDPNAELSAAST